MSFTLAAAAARRVPALQACRLLSSSAVSKSTASQSGVVDVVSTGQDKPTHTGQHWDKNDYRLNRFINKEKLVNERFAIDLVTEAKPIACKERVTSCNGGGGPLGHPKVFINLDQPGNHTCGYCGLRFYRDHDHGHGHH